MVFFANCYKYVLFLDHKDQPQHAWLGGVTQAFYMAVGHLPPKNSQVGLILSCLQLLDYCLDPQEIALILFSMTK